MNWAQSCLLTVWLRKLSSREKLGFRQSHTAELRLCVEQEEAERLRQLGWVVSEGQRDTRDRGTPLVLA